MWLGKRTDDGYKKRCMIHDAGFTMKDTGRRETEDGGKDGRPGTRDGRGRKETELTLSVNLHAWHRGPFRTEESVRKVELSSCRIAAIRYYAN
jgi:hypothetical protein